MAPRPFAIITLLAFIAAANAATVTIKIPFGPQGVPSVTDAPLQAGFRDKVLKAFVDGLDFIVTNGLSTGPAGSPPEVKRSGPAPIFTFDTTTTPQTATAVFVYPDAWLTPITFFVGNPQYLYNNGENPGLALVSQYGALPVGQTISLGTPVPPTVASPPPIGTAPPPPINARSPPPSPFIANTPPKPPSPPLPPNPVPLSVASLLVDQNLWGNQVPTDLAGRAAFQKTVLDATASGLNAAAGTAGIVGAPFFATFNYTLVPESSIGQGLRKLQQGNAPITCPPGFVWFVQVQIVWNNVPVIILTAFSTNPNGISNSIAIIIVQANSFTVLIIEVELKQVSIIITPSGVFIIIDITNPIPGYGNGFPGVGKRRLVERHAIGAATKALAPVSWTDAEPADIAYGTDKALFEIFSTPVDYFTAGAACAARGSKLASYKTEGAQIFIDILCDGSTGAQCWVEGNTAGACAAVSSSSIHQLACKKQMPFICVKEQGSAAKPSAAKESVEELAAAKPADVAFDSQHALFEVMSSTVDYFTAASVCLARGAQLATYESEAAQVFIDVLCENVTGQSCWVQGADNGKCSSVHLSVLQHTTCTKRQAFVCTKPAANMPKA